MTEQNLQPGDVRSVVKSQISSEKNDLDVINIIVQLVRRKILIAKVTLLMILVGIILCFVLPVKYSSTVELMPPQQLPSAAALVTSQLSGASASLASVNAGSVFSLKNPNDLYIGLIQSRPVADAIIQRFDLQKVYHEKSMADCRKVLADHTRVTSEKGNFITISVSDRDKNRVAQIANRYADELRHLTQVLAVSEASRRALFYENQLKVASNNLTESETVFQQTQQSKGVIQPDVQAKAMIEGLAQLRATIAAQEVTVQSLKSFSTENNPQLAIAERQLSVLRGQAASLAQRGNNSGLTDMGLMNLPAAGLEYFRAQRNVLYQQTLYDLLLKQYEAAKLDESKDAASIQIVEPGIAPERRSSPKISVILFVSTFLGVVFGCMLALVEWWRSNLQTRPEAFNQLRELKYALMHWT